VLPFGSKGYDVDAFVCEIQDRGAQAHIPPRSIATGFEKPAQYFAAMIALVCICVWLA
jgi:hypothetical protein